ncbi:MAG: hypothetical protein K2J78_06260 [Muribaculaceae bacterium]|nr:hypothetical protein [Muribaculaceae bacterium]
MKKMLYACVATLAIGLMACSGGKKAADHLVEDDSLALEPIEVESFEEIIADGYKITEKGIIPTGGRPMIVDFSADWCQPCQDLKPIFANLKNDFIGRIDCVIVNTD